MARTATVIPGTFPHLFVNFPMITVHSVEQLEHPDLVVYRTLRQPTEHFQNGMFVAEGEKVVRRLLRSRLSVLSLLLTPEWLESLRTPLEDHPELIRVFVASKQIVESIVGFHLHQGIMAIGKVPEPATLSSVITASPRPLFLVAVDGLANSENLGVLTRNGAAFGVHGIIVGETSSSPYLRRAVRNSMGTIFHLPVIYSTDLAETIRTLRHDHNVRVVAAHPHTNDATLASTDLRTDCCIVLGSEGAGISPRVLEACDSAVAVPMQNGVDSLNVASAAAVFFYEVFRQRQASPSETA
jgi:tRNA G18 (ribose-2'-O)-methylase SpoU